MCIRDSLKRDACETGRRATALIMLAEDVYKRQEYGNEDADASRRVEFKFRMQDEQMIESMRQLLEAMG